jgi:VanW like protein
LFNAAMRAGYDMKVRRNHYYYIDRYPLGLDATVFISASGSKQTMSFVNDTDYPVLIRGYGYRVGSAGYVKFEIYTVPNGRKVVIGKPTVKNVRYSTDTIQYTSSLPAGHTKRIEYPVDGKDVWRTVSVCRRASCSTARPITRTTRGSPASPWWAARPPAGAVGETGQQRPAWDRRQRDRATAQALGDRLGLGGADPEPAERVARHLHRQLPLAVDGLDLAAERAHVRGLPVAMRADDDVDARVERLDALHDEPRLVRLGRRHDHEPRGRDVGHL